MEHYYYKDENGYLDLLEPSKDTNAIQITKEEYEQATVKQPKQLNETKHIINTLKKLLADSDYKAIKYAEGLITEEEYNPIKIQRQQWRDEINRLNSLQ